MSTFVDEINGYRAITSDAYPYGGDRPTEAAIAGALKLLASVPEPDDVVPCCDGSVEMYWDEETRDVAIEVTAEGRVVAGVLYRHPDGSVTGDNEWPFKDYERQREIELGMISAETEPLVDADLYFKERLAL